MSQDGQHYAAPAFQFFARKWLDFRIARLNLFDQGALAKLQAFMWAGSGDQCSLEDDDRQVARAIGITARRWAGIKERLLQEPKPLLLTTDGRLVSPYLRKQAEVQRARRDVLSRSGKKGALKRWGGHGEANSQANGEASQRPIAFDGTSSSSSSSPSEEEESSRFASDHHAHQIAQALLDAIRSHSPGHKQPNIQEWARHADLMLRCDGRTVDEVKAVIQWAHCDPAGAFWQGNILSTRKLREKFDALVIKMRGGRARGESDKPRIEAVG